jgi:hypothetical protein
LPPTLGCHGLQVPFLESFRKAIQEQIPDALIFAESVVDFEHDGAIYSPVTLPDSSSFVWAAHHYDVITPHEQAL